MKLKKNQFRFWEIDLLRGLAIIFMILFHFLYDLNFFLNTNYDLNQGLFFYIGRLSAILFVFIAGLSLHISYSRVYNDLSKNEIILKFFKRGIKIFILGIIISIITFLYIPNGFIIFGVLHFIGISIILWIFFVRFRVYNFIFGIIFIILGFYFRTTSFGNIFLLPFGFIPDNIWTIDYFPLFPWFGIILIGSAFGNIFYPNFKRYFEINDFSNNFFVKKFCFLGRNSLIIYFFHQPIIIALLFLFFL
jgi:uncharacterized membrane protein